MFVPLMMESVRLPVGVLIGVPHAELSRQSSTVGSAMRDCRSVKAFQSIGKSWDGNAFPKARHNLADFLLARHWY